MIRLMIRFLSLALLSIFLSINLLQGQGVVSKVYAFENFDGARVDLKLNIEQAFIDASMVDWQDLLANPKPSPKANYFNLVEAHFKTNEVSLKFVFDVFDQALPYVTDSYFINTVIRFVQTMPYKLPPLKYQGIETGGLLAPILSLKEGWGDCDTKSLLLMCILGHRYEMLFLAGAKHAFIGIKAEPGPGQEYVEIKGSKYVLCEMTSLWRLGELPATSVKDINSGKYNYTILKY